VKAQMLTITINNLDKGPITLSTHERPRTLSAARELIRNFKQQYKERNDTHYPVLNALIAALPQTKESNS